MQGCSCLPMKPHTISDFRDVHAEHGRTEAAAVSDAYARWRAISPARAARAATGDLRDSISTPFRAILVCGGCMMPSTSGFQLCIAPLMWEGEPLLR